MRKVDLRAEFLGLRERLEFRGVISGHRLENLAGMFVTEVEGMLPSGNSPLRRAYPTHISIDQRSLRTCSLIHWMKGIAVIAFNLAGTPGAPAVCFVGFLSTLGLVDGEAPVISLA